MAWPKGLSPRKSFEETHVAIRSPHAGSEGAWPSQRPAPSGAPPSTSLSLLDGLTWEADTGRMLRAHELWVRSCRRTRPRAQG